MERPPCVAALPLAFGDQAGEPALDLGRSGLLERVADDVGGVDSGRVEPPLDRVGHARESEPA
jgi:hypothetical protein